MSWLYWNIQTKHDELKSAPVVHLGERFAALVDQEAIKEEFEYYQLVENAKIGMEEGNIQKSVDRYWGEIMKIKRTMGQMRLMSLVSTYSDADCERAIFRCPENAHRVASEP